MSNVVSATQKSSVIVGGCEYMLNKDGEVQHRLIGANHFLNCRDAQHPTPDEKTALQQLKAMEARHGL